jgi:hypothetical protein
MSKLIISKDTPNFTKYPEILRVEKQKEILDVDKVWVTEKIHGSNWRLKVTPEGIIMGSRNLVYDGTNDGFGRFIPIFEGLDHEGIIKFFLPDTQIDKEVIIFGEVYGGGYQHGVIYHEPVNFRVFDIMVGDEFLNFDTVAEICTCFRLPIVPLLYVGKPNYEELLKFCGRSVLTDDGAGEGIVVKAYGHKDQYGRPLFAKIVSERFAENKGVPKPIDPAKMAERETCGMFAEQFVTEARVRKMVEQLKELGNYTGEMKGMPHLIKLLWADLEKEEGDTVQDLLDKGIGQKSLNGACTKNLSKIYSSF